LPRSALVGLLSGAGSYLLTVLTAAFFAHRLALHFDPMRVMNEPVEDAIGNGRISDLGMPGGKGSWLVSIVDRV
jgi:hypothetical protein